MVLSCMVLSLQLSLAAGLGVRLGLRLEVLRLEVLRLVDWLSILMRGMGGVDVW